MEANPGFQASPGHNTSYPGSKEPGYIFLRRQPVIEGYKTEWIPVKPGSEALIAYSFANLVASLHTGNPSFGLDHDLDTIASQTSLDNSEILALANRFASAERKLAVPGITALCVPSGFSAAVAILKLNFRANNLGQNGGVFLLPPAPIYPHNRVASASSLEWKLFD